MYGALLASTDPVATLAIFQVYFPPPSCIAGALFRARIAGFVPRAERVHLAIVAERVHLKIVCQPDRGRARPRQGSPNIHVLRVSVEHPLTPQVIHAKSGVDKTSVALDLSCVGRRVGKSRELLTFRPGKRTASSLWMSPWRYAHMLLTSHVRAGAQRTWAR